MSIFTKDELDVLDRIEANKRLTDEEKELLPGLAEKFKMRTHTPSALLNQWRLQTGWMNRPKDYT